MCHNCQFESKSLVDGMEGMSFKPSPSELKQAARIAMGILKGLANDDRLLLLCHLTQGEANVGELELALGIRQPTLSQQLGILRKQNLVNTRRDGKSIYYRIEDPKVFKLLEMMHELYYPNKDK